MVRKGELTDEAWARIAPLLSENGRRGGRWSDHREVVNGILWKLRAGAPWRDLPARYAPWQTCYDRFVRWRRDGTWDRLLARTQTKSDAVGEVEWLVSVETALSSGRTSMPRVPAEGRASKTQKGGLSPRGRGARAQPRRADDQAAPLLRRQGPAAVGGRDPGPAPREHPDGGGARRDPGGALRPRSATQTPRPPAGRPGLQPREAGGQLPGDGGHRRADDLAVLVNHQTRPR